MHHVDLVLYMVQTDMHYLGLFSIGLLPGMDTPNTVTNRHKFLSHTALTDYTSQHCMTKQ